MIGLIRRKLVTMHGYDWAAVIGFIIIFGTTFFSLWQAGKTHPGDQDEVLKLDLREVPEVKPPTGI